MKISAILDQIDLGSIALPTFQRGYVWNREQIRGLMTSLYRRYPVGSLLMWQTKTESAEVRGDAALPPGTVELLLDGQQRVTTLYGIMRGKTPKFFDGKASIFEGLHFHLDTEVFEFYTAPMKNDPLWIDVTDVLQKGAEGAGEAILGLIETPELQSGLKVYSNRINALAGIGEIVMHLEKVTGEDKSIDVVVDIFNRVNSGGTKLSKGDLALAKICAEWPDARDEMRQRLEKWREAGFHFKLDWLLRCVNTITTGKALFNALEGVDVATFADGLRRAEKHVDYMLNLIVDTARPGPRPGSGQSVYVSGSSSVHRPEGRHLERPERAGSAALLVRQYGVVGPILVIDRDGHESGSCTYRIVGRGGRAADRAAPAESREPARLSGGFLCLEPRGQVLPTAVHAYTAVELEGLGIGGRVIGESSGQGERVASASHFPQIPAL